MTSWIACWPSALLITVESGPKAPALLLVVPVWSAGENGRTPDGHGEPPGPERISKFERLRTAAVPDHGVNEPWVV